MAQGSLPNEQDMEVDLRRQLNDVFGEFDDFAGLVGAHKQQFGVIPTSGVMRGLTPYSVNRLPPNVTLPSASLCLQEMKNVPPLIPPLLQANRIEIENSGCASEASSSNSHLNDEENANVRKKRKLNKHEEDGDGPTKRRDKRDDNKMSSINYLFDDESDAELKDRGNTMPRRGIRKMIESMQVEPLIPPIDVNRTLKKKVEDDDKEERERRRKKDKDELERRKRERVEDEERKKKKDEDEERRKKKDEEEERRRKRDEEEKRRRTDDDEKKRKRDEEERDKEKKRKEIDDKRKRKEDESEREEEERRIRKEKKRLEKEERRRKEEEEKLKEEEKERKNKEEDDEKRRLEEEEMKRENENREREELVRKMEEEKKREAERIKMEDEKKKEEEEEIRKKEVEEKRKREEMERKRKDEEDRMRKEKKREEEKRRSKEEVNEKRKKEHDDKGRKDKDERGKKEKKGSLPLDILSHSKVEALKERERKRKRQNGLSESKDEKSASLSLLNNKKKELKEEKMKESKIKDSSRIIKKEESSARSSPMSSKNSSRVATPIPPLPPLSLPSTSTHQHGGSVTPSCDHLFSFPHCPSSSCLASDLIPASPPPIQLGLDSEDATNYAKAKKHSGDASLDRHHRFFYYMESSLYFSLSVSTCHPAKSSDRELHMAGCVLKETFELVKHAIFLFEKEGNSHFLSRAKILCARIQAVLSYHMYFVRTNKFPRRGETIASLELQIQEVARESPKKEENGGSGGRKSGDKGDKNSTPSSSSTSVASNSSNMVTMPMSLWKMKLSQVSTYTHLELSHSRWNDSIKLVTSSEKHYWNTIDNLILNSFDWGCPLHVGSSLLHLSQFINTAVSWMRSEYDAERSR